LSFRKPRKIFFSLFQQHHLAGLQEATRAQTVEMRAARDASPGCILYISGNCRKTDLWRLSKSMVLYFSKKHKPLRTINPESLMQRLSSASF
jgi:hypothetical protein